MSRQPIVIVDPYSSGAMLAAELHTRGVECVAVQSSPGHPPSMRSTFDPSAFVRVIQHEGDDQRTLDAVKGWDPMYVIAGFESGVELAEWLSERLALPANDPALREARRDKFQMAEAAKRHGLRTAIQFQSNEVERILDWIRGTLAWPVILKPSKSVASDHVFCCRTVDEARRAAEAILSATNVLGYRNQAVLAQEFLSGTEYAVDTVSYEARTKTTAIWQYDRPAYTGDFVCYNAMRLLPYVGDRQDALQAYALEVLEALAIRFGPAHCELMWVDGSPVLIEVGARLSAGINAVLSRTCGGICQLEETIEAMLAPERFLATLPARPRLDRLAANVFLVPRQRGRLVRTCGLEIIRRLPTLHSMSVSSRPGDVLRQVAGLVTLVDHDSQAIENDIERIRALEREGIFEVEEESRA